MKSDESECSSIVIQTGLLWANTVPLYSMGCIISTSTLWESAAISAAVLCCDKPPLSACIYISYQLSGCNNRIGHHLTGFRRKPSRAIIKKCISFQLGNYVLSILWQIFHESVTAIIFYAVWNSQRGFTLPNKNNNNKKLYCTYQKTCRYCVCVCMCTTR